VIDVGSILAGYRIDGVAGRGATSTVYAATELAAARRVAIKVLADGSRGQRAVGERFRKAALLQQSLGQQNVLDVYEVSENGDVVFLVMQLVGGTLADLIADDAPVGRTLPILRQVADALDFAHGTGVVHGDVKPRNILVGEDDVGYLADFGLAVAVSHVASAGAASPGTIDYSAPERLRGEQPSPSADVYALACVLFECLTGSVPFPHDKTAAVVGGHLYDAPPRASELRRGLPSEIDEILRRGLAKDPAERPRSARELVDGTEAALGGAAAHVLAPPPPRAETRAARPADDTLDDPLPFLPAPPVIDTDEGSGVSRRVVALAVAGLALLGLAGAWLGHRGSDGAQGRPVARGSLVLTVPNAWAAAPAPRLPGLNLLTPLAVGPRGARRPITLVAGTVRTGPPTFLPEPVAAGLRQPQRRELVQLDGGVGYRYPAPKSLGRAATLFVLPGPEQSAIAACIEHRPGGGALRECEGVAGTLRIRRGVAYDAEPSRQFAAAYKAAMSVLRVARNSGLELLHKAMTRRMQGHAAIHAAVGYRTTSASIRRTQPPPIAQVTADRLLSAIDRAGVGYTRLGWAARRGDTSAYARARRLILDAEADIRQARRELLELGYRG
jgi:Protein kinase domain